MNSGKPWARIEQALRVTDLLLQAGGFSAIVLDMASIAPEYVSRVPLATWFRYRAAAERTQAVFASAHAAFVRQEQRRTAAAVSSQAKRAVTKPRYSRESNTVWKSSGGASRRAAQTLCLCASRRSSVDTRALEKPNHLGR